MRGAILPLPQYAFTAWCLVKHRDNFTFTFYYVYAMLVSPGIPTSSPFFRATGKCLLEVEAESHATVTRNVKFHS
jgi:hypothetical protein